MVKLANHDRALVSGCRLGHAHGVRAGNGLAQAAADAQPLLGNRGEPLLR